VSGWQQPAQPVLPLLEAGSPFPASDQPGASQAVQAPGFQHHGQRLPSR